MSYDFGKITPVPTALDFVNYTLHRTQRKTPTVVHKNVEISRIRRFYMRKVKYTQQTFHDRIKMIITEFPQADSMHPFYCGLIKTIYGSDHYKNSLGTLNIAMCLVDKVATDYVKLLKYGDTFFRCKQLKRAALGRMATIMRKQGSSLTYLEEVRQHMSRMPSINPKERTLILCGCPNAGKSSFINVITNANVEVQPYAFTTKSLFVGHTDYDYLKWQVLDTPGMLDRPIGEMNTIELHAINAIAHLDAALIFFLDISESCGYSIEQQINVYDSIKCISEKMPVIIACSKKDILSLEELAEKSPEKRAMVQALEDDGMTIIEISTVDKSGVMEVKSEACHRLLNQRVDEILRKKKSGAIENRINVAMPDNHLLERVPFIPESWSKKRKFEKMLTDVPPKRLEKDIENELMEDYVLDFNKSKLLDDDDWKYDKIPIYYNGYNISDFVDVNIKEKLASLEKEELRRVAAGVYNIEPEALTTDEEDILNLSKKINQVLIIKGVNKRREHGNEHLKRITRMDKAPRSNTTTKLRKNLTLHGLDMSKTDNAHFTCADRSRSVKRRKIEARSPSVSMRTSRDKSGVRDGEMLLKLKKSEIKQKRNLRKKGPITESDRKVDDLMPKHLFCGKRGIGKTERR